MHGHVFATQILIFNKQDQKLSVNLLSFFFFIPRLLFGPVKRLRSSSPLKEVSPFYHRILTSLAAMVKRAAVPKVK